MLEICIDNLQSAINAINGGANRLEVCNELVVGGLTPTYSLVNYLCKSHSTPLRCMVRPRSGDFCYTDNEFEQMQRDIKYFKSLNIEGVVFGILLPDGSLDIERMKKLIDLSGNMKVTMHRAFDMTSNAMLCLQQANELGIDTILTSGQKSTAWEGRFLIKELISESKETTILVGGDVEENQASTFYYDFNVRNFHLSASKIIESPMEYKNLDVYMGLPGLSEYEIMVTQESAVKSFVLELDKLKTK